MKRVICIGIMGLFLAGCGATAKESEFWQHNSMYTSWDHMRYSVNPASCTSDITKKSQDEKWWGLQHNECPGK